MDCCCSRCCCLRCRCLHCLCLPCHCHSFISLIILIIELVRQLAGGLLLFSFIVVFIVVVFFVVAIVLYLSLSSSLSWWGSWLVDRIPIATKGGKTAAGKDQIIHYTQQQRGKLFYTSTSNILNFTERERPPTPQVTWTTWAKTQESWPKLYIHLKFFALVSLLLTLAVPTNMNYDYIKSFS